MDQNRVGQYRPILVLGLIGLLIGLISACSPQIYEPPPTPTPSLPEIWLDWPVNGEYPPEPLQIISHVHDPSGQGLDNLELRINGERAFIIELPSKPFFDQFISHWPPDGTPEPGQYLVEVFAVREGQYSEPASALLTIVERRPEIEFDVDKTEVNLSECIKFSWTVVNAQRVQLLLESNVLAEQVLGSDDTIEGQYTDCPEQPTNVYQLVANPNTDEPEQKQTTVVVRATPKPPPGVEVSFEFDDRNYRAFGDCLTLFWVVENAQQLQLDRIDRVMNVGLRGEEQVCPTAPTNSYRLIGTSLTGETFERTLTFLVPATPTPTPTPTSTPIPTSTFTRTPTPTFTPVPTVTPIPTTPAPPLVAEFSLTVDDPIVRYGDCTRVRWTIKNVQAAFLNGDGVTGPQGSKEVCPEEFTTYVLTVNLIGGGTDTRRVTVDVCETAVHLC